MCLFSRIVLTDSVLDYFVLWSGFVNPGLSSQFPEVQSQMLIFVYLHLTFISFNAKILEKMLSGDNY